MRQRQDGYAVVTAIFICVVVLSLSLMAVGLSLHNSDGSALDRDRVKAVHAAEAGINDAMARILGAGNIAEAPCTVDAALSADPPSRYQTTITYYSAWPVDPAAAIACPTGTLPPTSVPLGAVIDSVGAAGRSQRRMQTAARLSPAYGGSLDKAIFSDGALTVKNHISVSGDIYTNADWSCTTGIAFTGDFYGQGSANMSNSCAVTGTLWVRNEVALAQSATVGGDGISGTSSITMSNSSHIAGRAVAATTCTGCVAPRIDPARLSIETLGAPPAEPLPHIWDLVGSTETAQRDVWTSAGYEIVEFSGASACGAAHDSIIAFRDATQPRVVRIMESCKLSFENNANVVLPYNLAIVTNGSMEFVNRGVWTTPDARRRDLFLIVPYGTSCTTGQKGEISKQNNTDFDHLQFLAYSPCKILFANNNPSSSGQVYAGTVSLENNFDLAYHRMLLPGMTDTTTIVGFSSEVAYIREVQLAG